MHHEDLLSECNCAYSESDGHLTLSSERAEVKDVQNGGGSG